MADTRIDELRRRLERDPGSRLFAQLAEELRKGGDLSEAIRVARSGLAVHPAYPSARLTLGRALLDSGDATGARAELESAVRDAPDNIQASRHLAQAREQLGDLKGAAEQYRKTLLMAPDDRQLQAALAELEARLRLPAGDSALAAETTPPAVRAAPPPLPARPATATATAQPGRAPAPPPLTTTQPAPLRAAAPPLVFAPSAPAAEPARERPALEQEVSAEEQELPPTVRLHVSQAAAIPPPGAKRAALAPPSQGSAAEVAVAAATPAEPEEREPKTLPGTAAAVPVAEAPEASLGASSTAPFSSSTLAELYFQQGLVDRAVDVYRQLLDQEPGNEKARDRLAELALAAPAVEERAARRRTLERTIAGLETLLGAVRRR